MSNYFALLRRAFWQSTLLLTLMPGAVWPAPVDYPLVAVLDSGMTVSLTPDTIVSAAGEPQRWRLTLADSHQAPLDPLSLAFEAEMPAHGHGLPEPAQVRATAQPGNYLVENVRFNMGGSWLLRVWVGTGAGMEAASFSITVGPRATSDGPPDRSDSPPGVSSSTTLNAALNALNPSERALLATLSLDALSAPADDPTNRFSGHPAAVRLGQAIFQDVGLSGSGRVACVSCHQPEKLFTDGLPRSKGSAELTRNAPGLLGVRHNHWFYWDGRRDSLWAQALTPLETGGEMDSTRTAVVRHVAAHPEYGTAFRRLTEPTETFADSQRFPPAAGPYASDGAGRALWQAMPATDRERVNVSFADVGKLLAAYEESLKPIPARFDAFARQLAAGQNPAAHEQLSNPELHGLQLFLDAGKTHCLRCHNGPLLTNQGFHAIGSRASFIDLGRQLGLDAARVDPFNCTGAYSDSRSACRVSQLAGVDAGNFAGAFKVPTLRNLTHTAPYFHDGRFEDLEAVMAFYRSPPGPEAGNHELPPLELTDDEASDLIAFLKTLSPPPGGYSSIAR